MTPGEPKSIVKFVHFCALQSRPPNLKFLACDGTRIFFTDNRNIFNFDLDTLTWSKVELEKLPKRMSYRTALIVEDVLIFVGGCGSRPEDYDFYVFDLVVKDMAYAPQRSIQPNVYGQAACSYGTYIYMVGGYALGEYYIDIQRINLIDPKWETVYIGQNYENEPIGRCGHAIVFVDEEIYLLGGQKGDYFFDFEKIYLFNMEMEEWIIVTTNPDPVYGYPVAETMSDIKAILIDDDIIISGTLADNDNLFMVFSWKIDVLSNTWSRIIFDNGGILSKGDIFVDRETRLGNCCRTSRANGDKSWDFVRLVDLGTPENPSTPINTD